MVSLDKLLQRQHGNCFYCRQHLPREHASRDHLQAASLDGSNAEGNLVACCTGINQKFGAMTVKEKMDIALQGVPEGWCSCQGAQACSSSRPTATVIALPVSRKTPATAARPGASAGQAAATTVQAHVHRVSAFIKRTLARGQGLPTRRDKLRNWLELNAKVPRPLVDSVLVGLQQRKAIRPDKPLAVPAQAQAHDLCDTLLRKLVQAAEHRVLPKSVLALHRWVEAAVGPEAAQEGVEVLSQHRLFHRDAGRLDVDVARAEALLAQQPTIALARRSACA